MSKVNIKSSTVEKGLELAKEFLGKLISPTIEELGLLISDNIKYLRFKNQIKILLKAKTYVEKNKVSLKEIPIKILVPLLENASLEENEDIQDKWAKMITNMADSSKNLQNHVFPYLLSQISKEEYAGLHEYAMSEKALQKDRSAYLDLIVEKKLLSLQNPPKEVKILQDRVNSKEQHGFFIELQEYEHSNLERLGLIRRLPPKIVIDKFKTGGLGINVPEEWHQLYAEYDTHYYGYRITELGERLIEICDFKE